KKKQHRHESLEADGLQDDGPRKEERDLEIEQDEQDRHEVVAHVELHARILEGLEAALVRRELFGIRGIRREKRADREKKDAEPEAYDDEEQDREVLFKHRVRPWACPPCNCTPRAASQSATARLRTLLCLNLNLVPTGRLELPRVTPLPPQDSVSTNFTTSAYQESEVRSQKTLTTAFPMAAHRARGSIGAQRAATGDTQASDLCHLTSDS